MTYFLRNTGVDDTEDDKDIKYADSRDETVMVFFFDKDSRKVY